MAVWLAARNAFDANRETIEIVHHLGAGDAQIAGIFQRSVLIDSALGAVLGAMVGAAILGLLGMRFAALQSGMVESGSLSPLDWVGVGLVPASRRVHCGGVLRGARCRGHRVAVLGRRWLAPAAAFHDPQ